MEKILVVDDSELVRQMLTDLLGSAGYTVVTAADSTQAMAAVRGDPPDLIFMDIMMPGMDGQMAARLIKFDRKYEDIPIIIFSSLAAETHEALSRLVGATVHLKKTTPPDEILSTVRSLLAQHREMKALRERKAPTK